MPNVHLYGGPSSGQTMYLSGWPQSITAPYCEPEVISLDSMAPSSMLLYAVYLRVTYADDEGVRHSRYIHEDIYRMMRLFA